jgi:deoxyribonuclease IV
VRKIGLHIRLTDTIIAVARYAQALQIPIFQCFFIQQESNKFITVSDDEAQLFLKEWRNKFQELYLHGSYWINLATKSSGVRIMQRELELARRLAFTHMIIHPGAIQKRDKKKDAIALIGQSLNTILKREHEIKIVLENSAHAGKSIGGDLHDFLVLKEYLDHPEKVLFCIDTAHAYSYGYDLASKHGLTEFIMLINKIVGVSHVALIHANDTKQPCGSLIDKHEAIGNGVLQEGIKQLVLEPAFAHIPLIMELPVMGQDEERAMLAMVKQW